MNPDLLIRCFRWLKSADRTEAELRERLTKAEFSTADIDEALRWLSAKRFLDDQRVADRQAELGRTRRKIGRARLQFELENRGVPEAVIQEVMADWDDESEFERANQLLDAKLKPSDGPAKAARLLAGRGFEEDVVREVIERRFPDEF